MRAARLHDRSTLCRSEPSNDLCVDRLQYRRITFPCSTVVSALDSADTSLTVACLAREWNRWRRARSRH